MAGGYSGVRQQRPVGEEWMGLLGLVLAALSSRAPCLGWEEASEPSVLAWSCSGLPGLCPPLGLCSAVRADVGVVMLAGQVNQLQLSGVCPAAVLSHMSRRSTKPPWSSSRVNRSACRLRSGGRP